MRVTDEQLQQLKKIAAKLPAIPFDLTLKNKRFVAELENAAGAGQATRIVGCTDAGGEVGIRNGCRLKFVEAQVAAALSRSCSLRRYGRRT